MLAHTFRRVTGSFLVDKQTALCAVCSADSGGGGEWRSELQNKEAGSWLEQGDLIRWSFDSAQ
jgi:hypothetical protein